MTKENLQNVLKNSGLKVTPQRVAILEAVYLLNNHPTAENISEYIRNQHANIAIGTVYKVLDILVEKKLIKKVKTEFDIMRYDAVLDEHHHLYCLESNRIEDYYDDELTELINNYFKNKRIPHFEIDDVKLQIKGKFLK